MTIPQDTIDISKALRSLRPGAEWYHSSITGLEWHDKKQDEPTQAEIDAEIIKLQSEYDAQEYARNRRAEYPSIQDVTVALAEKEEGDSTMWDEITAKRAAVKAKYTKP